MLMAGMVAAFGQTCQKTDTIVCDSAFTVKNLIGQDVYCGYGEWKIADNPTTQEQFKEAYGVELMVGIYFVYRNGKEERKFVVKPLGKME